MKIIHSSDELKGPSIASKPVFTFHELKKTTVFSKLSDRELHVVWNAGKVISVKTNEMITESAEHFVYVVLRGQFEVSRLSTSSSEVIPIEENEVFGPIDSILGRSSFQFGKCLQDSFLFVLSRDDLTLIFSLIPNLHKHVSLMRSSAALNSAREYEERLKADSTVQEDNSKKLDIRVVPRLSVWERNVTITMQDRTVYKVDNISASGLGVLGQAPGPLNGEITFTFEGSALDMAAIPLKGKITRVNENIFGVQLLELNPETKTAWEEIVFRALEVEIASTFKALVSTLSNPIEIHYEIYGFIWPAVLLGLGIDGALIETNDALASDRVSLTIPLQFSQEDIKIINVSCKVLEKQAKGYLLQFLDLNDASKQLVEKYMAQAQPDEVKDKEVQPEKRITNDKLIEASLDVENGWILCMIYFQELRENILVVPQTKLHQLGAPIRIHLTVGKEKFFHKIKKNKFCLEGFCNRFANGKTIVEIGASGDHDMILLRKLVRNFGFNQFRQEFSFKRNLWLAVKRRVLRIFLLSMLLLSCVLMAWVYVDWKEINSLSLLYDWLVKQLNSILQLIFLKN